MAIIYVLSLCHLQPLSESHDHIVVCSLDIALEKRNFSYFTQSMEVTVSTHSCPLKHVSFPLIQIFLGLLQSYHPLMSVR